jgi:hypothetical protein
LSSLAITARYLGAADGGWPVYSMRPHEPYLLGRPAAAAAAAAGTAAAVCERNRGRTR